MEEYKMNILEELVRAVTDRKSYVLFLQDKKRKTFLFGFILVTLYYLVAVIVPYAQFQAVTGGFVHMLDQNVPDFTMEDGTLSVDRIYDMERMGTYIHIDTTGGYAVDEEQMRSDMEAHGVDAVIAVDQNQAVLYNNDQFQTLEFAGLGEGTFTKESLLENVVRPYVKILTVVILVAIFLFMQAGFFLGVVFVALIGLILASAMGSTLGFGKLYQMGVYSRTLPLLLKAVLSLLPFSIPLFWVLSLGISLFYLAGGIREEQTRRLAGPRYE